MAKYPTGKELMEKNQAQSQPADDPYMAVDDTDPYMEVDTIPNTENFIQRAIRVSQGVPQGFADVSTFGGTALARGAAEKLVPLPPEAEVEYKSMTATDPTATVIGGAIPIAKGALDIGKFGINALFGKQLAKRALPKATGKLTKSIQEVIKRSKANPSQLGIPRDEVVKVMEEGFAKSKVPHGEQKAVFQRWINALKNSPKFKNKPMLDADDISQIETAFGKAAKYGKTVNDPILQQSAKEVNRFASDRLDLVAKKAGVPEFIKESSEKSKLLRQAKAKPGYLKSLIRKSVELGAAGAVGGGIASKILPRD